MRILIATVTAGAGHVAAAAALEEAWRAARPSDTVERIDLTKFFSPLHKKFTKPLCEAGRTRSGTLGDAF
ncbi:MAG: hypothetical protein WDM76_18850 [Limisphaerales bacterium]